MSITSPALCAIQNGAPANSPISDPIRNSLPISSENCQAGIARNSGESWMICNSGSAIAAANAKRTVNEMLSHENRGNTKARPMKRAAAKIQAVTTGNSTSVSAAMAWISTMVPFSRVSARSRE